MFATLTSKGQITLPKQIRDLLSLDVGATLDFQVLEDNTITARLVKPDARRIRGLLKSPHAKALTVAQMDEAVAKHLIGKHLVITKPRKSARR
jgi:antitoxin PrlF